MRLLHPGSSTVTSAEKEFPLSSTAAKRWPVALLGHGGGLRATLAEVGAGHGLRSVLILDAATCVFDRVRFSAFGVASAASLERALAQLEA